MWTGRFAEVNEVLWPLVVLDADELSEEDMQTIATEVNGETAFVLEAESGDLRVGRDEALRHEHARDFRELDVGDGLAPPLGRELREERDLALADDLHAPRVDVVREARERQAELLDARHVEQTRRRAALPGQEPQTEVRRRVRDEVAHRDRRTLIRIACHRFTTRTG